MSKVSVSGLRNVLVYVWLAGQFPPDRGSGAEVQMLRAANRSLQRSIAGREDSVLFLVVGALDFAEVSEAVGAYGFLNAEVVTIAPDGADTELPADEEVRASIDDAVARWLSREHPGAIPKPFEREEAFYWWTGVECNALDDDLPLLAEDVARELPGDQAPRALTWLAILAEMEMVRDFLNDRYSMLAKQEFRVWVATLGEWLSGFQAVLEDDFDSFVDVYESGLLLNDFFLGFELARLSGDWIDSLSREYGDDLDDLPARAMKAVRADRRDALVEGLKQLFGGAMGLFWSVHSMARPDFSAPPGERLQEELALDDEEGSSRLVDAWRYVETGWGEEADW